ncbi:MAG TPA: hypothetical protein PLU80_16045, partial [Acidobacteriota bacterium]|nr:hypothetical protein [Acidobacteriota bacterium]
TSSQSLSTFAIALQPDGKIVIGGDFNFVAGQPAQGIARLNPDGTRDTTFNSSANDLIWTLGLQADGKLLVGGDFSMLGGQPCSRIGRLNADGTLDTSFPGGADSTVRTVLIQPDGKIVVGGAFTTLSGQPRSRIGRLNLDGTVDMAFNPGADGPVVSLALQTNGKIIAGGEPFFTLGGQPRNSIGRLNADGTIDPTFNPGAGSLNSIAIQTDGKIVVGGSFFSLGGQSRIFIGRVTNPDAAVENLSVDPFGTTLTWQRSGSSPEVQRVLFEQSTDGVNFTPLGNGTRIAGGWQLTGLTIPFEQNLFFRARGVGSGLSSGSHSLYESVTNIFLPCALPATVSGSGAICLGTPSLITVTVSGGVGPYTVTLNNGGGTQTGSGPIFNFPVSPAETTTYSVQSGSDSTGCAIFGTSSATVTVTPVASVNPVTPPAICGGTPTSIPLTSTPGGATLSWMIGPVTGTVTGQAAGSGSTISQTLNGSGTVTYLV